MDWSQVHIWLMPPPWHFTTWPDLLDHWQSLAAGLVAVFAAIIAIGGTELFARLKERREIAAIRASLGVEIRLFIVTLLETHKVLTRLIGAFRKGAPITGSEVKSLAELPEPTVFPATADRVGHLGSHAGSVVAFYAKIEHIKYSVKVAADAAERLFLADFNRLAELFEETCRESLPLLDVLPVKEADDAAIRAEIAGMGKLDQPQAPS